MVARVVACAVADPTVQLTTKALAIASGLTQEEVRSILHNPVFRDVVEAKAATLAISYMARSLQVLNEIAGNERLRPSDRIMAINSMTKTYVALANSDPKRLIMTSRQEVEEALQTLERMDNNASSGRLPDRADSGSEEEDGGRDRAAG